MTIRSVRSTISKLRPGDIIIVEWWDSGALHSSVMKSSEAIKCEGCSVETLLWYVGINKGKKLWLVGTNDFYSFRDQAEPHHTATNILVRDIKKITVIKKAGA